jgi:hypothetical protein
MLVLRLELPQVLLIDIIDLLFGMDPVPEEEIINFIIIFAYVILYPYVIYRIGSHAHSPHVLTMLNVQVLGQHSARGIQLVNKSHLLRGLKLTHPFVHELTW